MVYIHYTTLDPSEGYRKRTHSFGRTENQENYHWTGLIDKCKKINFFLEVSLPEVHGQGLVTSKVVEGIFVYFVLLHVNREV